MLEMTNKVEFGYDSLDEAFPPCDPGITPLGSRVLCQLRTPKHRTKGGIILTDEVREIDQWNTQIAKVVSIGPLAFCNRNTGEPWTEGAWCQIGDFVRVPKYGGDRWSIEVGEHRTSDEATGFSHTEKIEALLVIFNDLDLIGKAEDPLAIKAFI
jgi:co-chaperonin GroES (HSP10)